MTKPRTISHCIGRTPLIRISDQIYAKLETVNPSGSIKDRMAAFILDEAERRGELKPGGTIVEATSGNTGIAFAMLAAERGYKLIVVMPSNMSIERKQMIRAFGAEIVEVGAADFTGAVTKRDELVQQYQAFNPNQFANPDNTACHYRVIGPEIIDDIKKILPHGIIDAFVAGTGTGGTLMGASQALREQFPTVQTIAVEPVESAVMTGGEPHEHMIQGIGDGFIPAIVDMQKVDQVITVSSSEAIQRMHRLSTEFGLLVGISSGANVAAAEKYIAEKHPQGIVITVLPDRQERYFSILQ